MINISKVDSQLLSKLAGAYLHAGYVFRVEPIEASKKKQHKIRKWICKHYIELINVLPEEINIFSVANSDEKVLLFLKDCCTEIKRIEQIKKDKFEEDLSVVDLGVKSAFKQFLDFEFWPEIKTIGDTIEIITDDTPAYRRILTLKKVDGFPKDKVGYYCHNLGFCRKKDENKFCFYGELEEPVEELSEPFALVFEDAEVKIKTYNACNNISFGENPWDFLRRICFAIGMKSELHGDYCNNKEKELLPLIKEIISLEAWSERPESEFFSFHELKKLANQYGHKKVELLLTKLETIKLDESAFYKIIKKLSTLLCEQQYEPLWREIYNKISDSQNAYSNKVESLCDKELLVKVRQNIQKLMESKGYIGTYPDFVKDGALKGIHLERYYNMTYFVGIEKRVQYHIHCCESFDEDDYLTIQFLCGTALMKKSEKTEDIFGCLFNANGRRLFHTVHHYVPLQKDENKKEDDLETSINIAVKKAECKKLTKKEQKEYYGKLLPRFSTFIWIFLIAGGMFGIAMTLIVMLLCIITTVAFGLFSDVSEMFSVIPWGLILAIGWIGFGGAMGIVEVLALRK